METFAYLHTACAYDDPETAELTLNGEQLNVGQWSSQAGLLMLQLLVPVAILAVAGQASALQAGDRGPSVTVLQDRLRSAGYFNRSSTGIYSSITTSAVRQFQASRGLAVDGIAGPATQRALRGQTAASGNYYRPVSYSGGLRLGSRGADVTAIQQQLRNLGYGVSVDGIFGSATDQAVRQFQASNRLAADGIVGPATRDALYNGVNAGNPYPNYPNYPNYPSGGNGSYFPPVSTQPPIAGVNNRYVVVVPAKSSAILFQVRRFEPNAVYTSSNLGKYVWAGAFAEKGIAEARATLLRANSLDAQVRYF